MATFFKYGYEWKVPTTAFAIEKWCIRKGENLFQHYRELHRLLWPDHPEHKWTDLVLREFTDLIEKRQRGMLGFIGPASTGKTFSASKFALSHYFVYPDETAVLLTTTTRDKLDMSIFAEVKSLHSDARKHYPSLPGTVIEYKYAITTESDDETEARDFRKGVKGLACFPTGTLIDTPSGPRAIETLKVGDVVLNAGGAGCVKLTHQRFAPSLIRVTLADGRTFDCTPEHPVLTASGWVKAVDLNAQSRVISPHETMRLLQEACSQTGKPGVLQSGLQGEDVESDLSRVPSFVRLEGPPKRTLLEVLYDEIEDGRPGIRGKDCEINAHARGGSQKSTDALGEFRKPPTHVGVREVEGWRSAIRLRQKELGETPIEWREGFQGARQWMSAESSRARGHGAVSRGAVRANHSFASWLEQLPREDRLSALRQTGLWLVGHQTSGGSGWRMSLSPARESTRRTEGESAFGTRVDRVEILQRAGDERYIESEGGYRVFNLEVTGHPSYSVNHVVVHNCYKGSQWVGIGPYVGIKNKWVFLIADDASLCDISYLRATANLDKNEHFVFVPIGNPVNGEHTPLGQSCEPEAGWASVKDITKTTVWDTKYPKGRCINFVGTDSPNFNDDGTRYPFLIDQERIDSTLKFYGPHSEEFNAMCIGVMRPGEDSQRVLTKQLCEIHKAFEKAVWKGVARTKIYAVDAAYGGDRCVGGHIEFGDDSDGHQIVRVPPPHVIKVGMKRGKEPEDEIAEAVQSDCLAEGIPVENIFYDSTGRGTLGAAFARVFGSVIPVPVEFGGRPTQRPVRLDLFIVDVITRQRRLKRCDEEYGKRVSEFWFAVRWLTESEQLRELPESVAREFYMREWGYVAGNKRDVEPKDKTKQRIGRSPDEADWLCFCGSTQILTPRGAVPISALRPGDAVETPFGVTSIARVHESFTDRVTAVRFSDGETLRGRGKHRVFTWDKGWVPMQDLTIDNAIESAANLQTWRTLNSWFTRDESTAFKQLVDIIKTRTGAVSMKSFYTELSGLSDEAAFLKACACITRTAIGQITASRIWNSCREAITARTIFSKCGERPVSGQSFWRLVLPLWLKLHNGTKARLVESSTAKAINELGAMALGKSVLCNAPTAGDFSESILWVAERFTFAPSPVWQRSTINGTPTTVANALCAARRLLPTGTREQKLAPVSVRQTSPPVPERVYNLTLNEHNVYYANGILVDNCTAVEGARQRGLQIQKLGADKFTESGSQSWLAELNAKHHALVQSLRLKVAA